MEEGDNPHLSTFENFTSSIKSLDLNISPENLSGWEEWEELNATLNMFGRDKKHLDGTAYSVILICYVVVVIIAGETEKRETGAKNVCFMLGTKMNMYK